MVEASPVKFYFAKYFLLVFALLLWVSGAVLFYVDEVTIGNMIIDTSLVFLGLFLIFLFSIVSQKIKRVAIGKNKFVILEDDSNIRFGVPEIKSFHFVPLINLCKVKIKGKKGSFYFFTTRNIQSFIDLFSVQQKNKLTPGRF